MLACSHFHVSRRPRFVCAFLLALFLAASAWAQKSPSATNTNLDNLKFQTDPLPVKVRVLDSRGLPLDSPAQVHLVSRPKSSVDLTQDTHESSVAVFPSVRPGDYEITVASPGFKETTQHLHVANWGQEFSVFVYLQSESQQDSANFAKLAPVKPGFQRDINKGLEFLQKKQYEKAVNQFTKVSHSSPENPDLWYLRGTAEMGLAHKDAARKDFQQALFLEPNHERSLLALAQMQLEAGDTSAAIASLEQTYRMHGAGWRTHFLLASAYAQANRLPDAESHATRAASMAGRDAPTALLLLANIQYRQGKKTEATQTWEQIVVHFPGTASAKEANQKISALANSAGESGARAVDVDNLPLPLFLGLNSSPEDTAWAPPDIDSKEYPTANGITCNTQEVLDLAQNRLNTQLLNFEKFTATEHVVHQEIDRAGAPTAPKEKQFAYIVFVYPYAGNSLYLEESRDGGPSYTSFPTSMITTGINSLGVALLQPITRPGFSYQCEGLTSVRGTAAWQIRFEEKNTSTASIRRWRDNNATYQIHVKGRVWLASASYDMLRIETDLVAPVRRLDLTRDHLQVDYGPVSFQQGTEWLWLPWSAELYMEFRHRRYHHQHFLTDYLLFGVDETQKVHNPKGAPPESTDPGQ